MPGEPYHALLGEFLRTRRARLAPEAVGLSPGRRRRSPGLLREEVAVLANVSPTWYAYLEQGRNVRPSAEVLENLAAALRLDSTERRYLHALGGGGQSQSVLPEPGTRPEAIAHVCRLMEASSTMPYPVYAVEWQGDLIAWNEQVPRWYDDFSRRRPQERNILWWMFTAREARERIVGWDDDAREAVGRIRFSVGTRPASATVDSMLRDLQAESPDFARWWEDHDVVDQESRYRTFRHPERGEVRLELLVVRPDISPSVSIVFHLPPTNDGDEHRWLTTPAAGT